MIIGQRGRPINRTRGAVFEAALAVLDGDRIC